MTTSRRKRNGRANRYRFLYESKTTRLDVDEKLLGYGIYCWFRPDQVTDEGMTELTEEMRFLARAHLEVYGNKIWWTFDQLKLYTDRIARRAGTNPKNPRLRKMCRTFSKIYKMRVLGEL